MIVHSKNSPLDSIELHAIPTLYSEKPWDGVSSKYSFLSTGRVIDTLAQEGIHPYSVHTSRTKDESRRDYTKHLMRFRPTQQVSTIVGGVHPEVVMTNSHDTGSSFAIEMGLFRLVCSNGLVVSGGVFESFRVRHVGTSLEDVMRAVHTILDQFPQVEDSVKRFQSVSLSFSEQQEYAARAIGLRYPDLSKSPYDPTRLLTTKRLEDAGRDLWRTYNVVQENLLQGQRAYRSHERAVRAIKSIDKDLSINRGLWSLTEEFAAAHV